MVVYNKIVSNSKYKQSLQWYKNHAVQYSQNSKDHAVIDREQLINFVTYIKTGKKILDAGCGSGRDTSMFADLGFDAVGIDLSLELLLHARASYPHVDFRTGDILNLDFEDRFFDGVWAHASIVHFETDQQIERAFSELVRVLKIGGILHVLVRAKIKEKTNTRPGTYAEGCERFYRNFDREELERNALSRNLEIIQLSQYKESDVDPNKRPGEDIRWILLLGKKY